MAERKLPTTTTINYHSGGTVDIILAYNGQQAPCSELLPHITSVGIAENAFNLNGTSINQGELYAILHCYPDWIQLAVDNSGLLSIIVYNEDEIGYSVDADEGNLNFTL